MSVFEVKMLLSPGGLLLHLIKLFLAKLILFDCVPDVKPNGRKALARDRLDPLPFLCNE